MTQSTSTILDVVNKVLLSVGERQVTAIQSPTSLKALSSIEDALREIENLDDWSWTRNEVTASSWSTQTATLAQFQRIHNITYRSTTLRREVTFIERNELILETPVAFTSSETNIVPLYYTILNDTQVLFNPYPNDVTTQGYVKFIVSSPLTISTSAANTLPIPERFVLLLTRLASSLMAIRHLEDLNLGTMFRREFESLLVTVRGRENLQPSRGTNLFRRTRTRY